jgi:putative tricarboxylic transport membrane protein
MDDRQMAKADFVTAILLILGSLFIIFATLRFPRYGEWGPLFANPGFVPFLLALTLLGMSVYLLTRAIRGRGHEISIDRENTVLFFRSPRTVRFLICMGLFILYYALLGRVTFIAVTTVYLFLSILIFGRGSWIKALLISLAASFAIYIVFLRIFLVPLP